MATAKKTSSKRAKTHLTPSPAVVVSFRLDGDLAGDISKILRPDEVMGDFMKMAAAHEYQRRTMTRPTREISLADIEQLLLRVSGRLEAKSADDRKTQALLAGIAQAVGLKV